MHNFLLGGKDNNQADRATCLELLQHLPDLLCAIRASRLFMHRAVRYLARYARIRQFIDLGCGLPMAPDVHDVARRHGSDVRTIYVDSDRLVAAYARGLLAIDPGTMAVEADLTSPERILTNPRVGTVLNLSEPAAILLVNAGHLLDEHTIRRIATTVTGVLVPGSFLAVSHLAGVGSVATAGANQLADELGLSWRFRTPTQVRRLLAGLRPVRPGLVDVTSWRPGPQPELYHVDSSLRPYLAEQPDNRKVIAFGGVLKPRPNDTDY